ncbi:MAG: insulinase family protein [Candidatus Firestonebacteria bacterium]|nr:insulinase family protein [Candidatus Firestonebacteria bacterium]
MIDKITLPNGIRLIMEELPYLRSVSIGIWVLTGSSLENHTKSGISHFLEHMLFKGTEKRTAKQIVEELDSVGGDLQAFTSREFTCFSARVLDDHLLRAIDVLHDIVVNSVLPEEEIQKEKGVVQEEIFMYEDTPGELIHDLYTSKIWQDHPLGLSILGTEHNVKNFTQDKLMEYYHKYYSSNNIVIAAAGNLKKENFISKTQEYFSSLGKQNIESDKTIPEAKSSINIYNKKLEQVHFCLGTHGLSFVHPSRYSLYLLNSIIGGSMSSRLFQSVREKHGLVYNIYSYQSSYSSAGVFSIYAGTAEKNFLKVIEIVLEELYKLKSEYLSEKELRNVKEQLKGGITLSMESSESRMGHLAKSEIYFNHYIALEEIFKNIDEVKLEDILNLAKELFQPKNITMVALGPVNDDIKDKIDRIIAEKL